MKKKQIKPTRFAGLNSIRRAIDNDGMIKFVMAIPQSALSKGVDGLNDFVDEYLGKIAEGVSGVLTGISYKLVGERRNGDCLFEVTGDASGLFGETPSENPLWLNDNIQFARLISELESIGVFADKKVMRQLSEETDLYEPHILELIDRAQKVWDEAKAQV